MIKKLLVLSPQKSRNNFSVCFLLVFATEALQNSVKDFRLEYFCFLFSWISEIIHTCSVMTLILIIS